MFALVLVLIPFFHDANNRLCITHITCESSEIPEAFDGFVIVQLSDLHNKTFRHDNAPLLDAVRGLHPDIIVLTGDTVDASNHTDVDAALHLMQQLPAIAPCYYVTGNHEHLLKKADRNRFLETIVTYGITDLDDASVLLTDEQTGGAVALLGVDDNSLGTDMPAKLTAEAGAPFTVMLAHEPQYLQDYAEAGADLVLTGHAHGGQWRIPLTSQGLYAPDQGIFPDMTEGVFRQDGTVMVISRGIGNSAFPLRAFNRPEIVTVTLRRTA